MYERNKKWRKRKIINFKKKDKLNRALNFKNVVLLLILRLRVLRQGVDPIIITIT